MSGNSAVPVRVAVAQAASLPSDTVGAARKAATLIREAAGKEVRLVVFPEAFLGGYPKGNTFGAPVGMRTPEGRESWRKYHEAAIDLDGEEVAIIAEATAATGMFVVIGCIERDLGTLYCTALFFDGARGLIGKHRKLMPTAAERLIWGFGDGSTMPVFETPIGRIGAVICWENYMPLLRTAMYAKNIEIYCAPTADGRPTWLPTMQHVALEGRCFVLSCNQFSRRSDFPADYEPSHGSAPDTVISRGGSCIISPLGEVLAGPNFDGECVLTAELDLGEIPRAKFDFDVVGHYARPDIFRLHVNEQPMPAVVTSQKP